MKFQYHHNFRPLLRRLAIITILAAGAVIGQSFYMAADAAVQQPAVGCDSIIVPELNKKVLAFVEGRIGEKIGEGDDWDLVAEALNSAGAKWDGEYKYGRHLDLKKECIFPGDIIHFENVKINYKYNNTYYHESLDQHTAIVYAVFEQDNFNIAEQNTSRLGQKMGITPLDLKNIKSGKFKVYRPVN